ncbi:hypothetical protein KIPB_011244, partial [Kipferlia bialata]
LKRDVLAILSTDTDGVEGDLTEEQVTARDTLREKALVKAMANPDFKSVCDTILGTLLSDK